MMDASKQIGEYKLMVTHIGNRYFVEVNLADQSITQNCDLTDLAKQMQKNVCIALYNEITSVNLLKQYFDKLLLLKPRPNLKTLVPEIYERFLTTSKHGQRVLSKLDRSIIARKLGLRSNEDFFIVTQGTLVYHPNYTLGDIHVKSKAKHKTLGTTGIVY